MTYKELDEELIRLEKEIADLKRLQVDAEPRRVSGIGIRINQLRRRKTKVYRIMASMRAKKGGTNLNIDCDLSEL